MTSITEEMNITYYGNPKYAGLAINHVVKNIELKHNKYQAYYAESELITIRAYNTKTGITIKCWEVDKEKS